MTPEKELYNAKLLKHSLELTIKHLQTTKKDVTQYKKQLTKIKKTVTRLEKKFNVTTDEGSQSEQQHLKKQSVQE